LALAFEHDGEGGYLLATVERKSIADGIRALRQEILSKARKQAEDLLEEAKEEAEVARQEAEKEAQSIKARILGEARKEAALDRRRTISAARLEAQRTLLAKREEIISQVFAQARQRLAKLRHSDAYPDVLQRLIAEAAASLGGGDLVVWANAEDMALLDDKFLTKVTRDLGPGTKLKRGGHPIDIDGGVIVECADGHMRYDNSFAARLERFRDELRNEVYHILTEAS